MTTRSPQLRLFPCAPALVALLVLLLAPSASAQAPAATGGLGFGTPTLVAAPALLGQPLTFGGTLGSGGAHTQVNVQVWQPDGAWRTVATTATDATGGFRARWKSPIAGRFTARSVLAGPAVAANAQPVLTTIVTIYRRATATWYDMPGRTGACGVPITKRTLGIAHKTLPCGSKVDISFRGRTITVPVIDRGPFVRGVSYDLTLAAAKTLALVAVGRAQVGVLPEAERTPAPDVFSSAFGSLSIG